MLLIAFALRALTLDAQGLWFDEGWSWHLATMPLDAMARTTAADRSPPLYYALLHGWILLGGDSAFTMRFLSALADTAAVALTAGLALALTRSRAAALSSSALYAALPFAVWYAQETRMYALVAALGAASSLALWRWLRTGNWRWLVSSTALLGLAAYSHYYAVFLLPAHGLVVLVRALPQRVWMMGRYALAASGLVVALLPWLAFARGGFAYDDGFYFPLNTIEGRLLEWARAVAAGGLVEPPQGWALAMALPAGLGVLGFLSSQRYRAGLVAIALVVVPLLAATVAVRLFYPNRSVFHPRYVIYVLPALCVVYGAGWLLRPRWAAPIAGSTALLVCSALWLPTLSAYLRGDALQREDTRQATLHVVEALEPGDVVVMSRDNFAVRYYWSRTWAQVFGEVDASAESQLIALPVGLHGVLADDRAALRALNDARPRRVRLMLWQDNIVDPQRLVESTLWHNGYQIGEYNFAQIRLPLYQIQRRPLESIPFSTVGAVFGEHVELRRAWQREQGYVGDWFYVVLEWSLRRATETDYKVFVHIRTEDGQVVFQSDRQPLNPLLPMRRWRVGQPYRDPHAMIIPPSTVPMRYRVFVGLYDPNTGQRLVLADGRDAFDLGEMEVLPR